MAGQVVQWWTLLKRKTLAQARSYKCFKAGDGLDISYFDDLSLFGGDFTTGLAYVIPKKVSALLVFPNYWPHSWLNVFLSAKNVFS